MRHSVLPEHIVDVLVSESVPDGGQQLSAHHHSRSLLAIIPTSIRSQTCGLCTVSQFFQCCNEPEPLRRGGSGLILKLNQPFF